MKFLTYLKNIVTPVLDIKKGVYMAFIDTDQLKKADGTNDDAGYSDIDQDIGDVGNMDNDD